MSRWQMAVQRSFRKSIPTFSIHSQIFLHNFFSMRDSIIFWERFNSQGYWIGAFKIELFLWIFALFSFGLLAERILLTNTWSVSIRIYFAHWLHTKRWSPADLVSPKDDPMQFTSPYRFIRFFYIYINFFLYILHSYVFCIYSWFDYSNGLMLSRISLIWLISYNISHW